ncbi:MAG: ABC transporter permease [Acidimicrobiia bacterium]
MSTSVIDPGLAVVEERKPPVMTAFRSALPSLMAVLAAFVLFAVFILVKGVNPLTAYHDMFTATLTEPTALGDIAIRATPIVLAALAVTVPARAGLINVGGEGQLMMGGLGAMAVSLALGGNANGPLTLVLMALAGMAAGAIWAAFAAVLRLVVGISESVTTLLLNYIALDLLLFLIYDPWKDLKGSGQPATEPLHATERLPIIGDGRVHLGVGIALVAAVVLWALLSRTAWGFRIRVVGGNSEAARRSGLPVGPLLISAMAVGGAMAGLGGFVQLAGVEFKLRQGFLATYGYIGFLASWLGRHRPLLVVVSGTALAAIAIGGNSLQIDSGLPAASVNVLMALLLLSFFWVGKRRTVTS